MSRAICFDLQDGLLKQLPIASDPRLEVLMLRVGKPYQQTVMQFNELRTVGLEATFASGSMETPCDPKKLKT